MNEIIDPQQQECMQLFKIRKYGLSFFLLLAAILPYMQENTSNNHLDAVLYVVWIKPKPQFAKTVPVSCLEYPFVDFFFPSSWPLLLLSRAFKLLFASFHASFQVHTHSMGNLAHQCLNARHRHISSSEPIDLTQMLSWKLEATLHLSHDPFDSAFLLQMIQ